MGHAPSLEAAPSELVTARVPGAVQLDWARAHGWDPHFQGENWRHYGWMEDVFWTYRAQIEVETGPNEQLFFVSKGIDYRFQVRWNGLVLLEREGMFSGSEVPLSGSGILEIVVFPAPKSGATPHPSQANQSVKPAVSYGWDFHPRLIPLGIWDEAWVEVRTVPYLGEVETLCELAVDLQSATVTCCAEVVGEGTLRLTVWDSNGREVHSQNGVGAFRIENPRLWWPNEHGEAHLYRWRVELLENGEIREGRFGARRVRLVQHPTAWTEFGESPLTQVTPPITLEVNGRALFVKGSNWVCPDIFPGTLTREIYAQHLQLAQNAHFNLLRCWGGAIVNKDAFFELCDEMGLLVWQEFPLACNCYEGTPDYLAVLDAESKAIIRRLRHHPCLALWCGGNELFNQWSRMTEQDAAIRLLNRNCFDLDPLRPFLSTSPVMGIGHGNYLFRESSGREAFQMFLGKTNTAYTEFGCSGASNVEVLKSFLPAGELFPPRRKTAWQSHHAFDGWDGDSESWLMLHLIEEYCGAPQNLEELVASSQWLQCEAYKALFEEARRQKPRCSMALNWCFNEPWPTAANNSLVNWPSNPKPAFYAVAASCRPTLLSARIVRFRWEAGEPFSFEWFLLHDAFYSIGPFVAQAYIEVGGLETLVSTWNCAGTAESQNASGPKIEVLLPSASLARFVLHLRVVGRDEWNSSYELALSLPHG